MLTLSVPLDFIAALLSLFQEGAWVHGAPRLSQQQLDAAHYSPFLKSRSEGFRTEGNPRVDARPGSSYVPVEASPTAASLSVRLEALPNGSPTVARWGFGAAM